MLLLAPLVFLLLLLAVVAAAFLKRGLAMFKLGFTGQLGLWPQAVDRPLLFYQPFVLLRVGPATLFNRDGGNPPGRTLCIEE